MPIVIDKEIPAFKILTGERCFVMDKERAHSQEIRPIEIAILNLMPTKETTETQFMRLLSNSPLQVNITLIKTSTYKSTHTEQQHLERFYKNFSDIKGQRFDGMIVTGAPVENMEFEEVAYWDELKEILDWTATHVTSTLYICWAAQAGLYHYYGIPKYPLERKLFGVFEHTVNDPQNPIFRGFDDVFFVPHSRHSEVRADDIRQVGALSILSESPEAGVYMVMGRGGRELFVTGHSEYSPYTLDAEYRRDLQKGLPIDLPRNYYRDNDPARGPLVRWRSHANLLFTNWLNYFVYQETPYKLEDIR